MNLVDAFNIVKTAARKAPLSFYEHEQVTKSLLALKDVVENQIAQQPAEAPESNGGEGPRPLGEH